MRDRTRSRGGDAASRGAGTPGAPRTGDPGATPARSRRPPRSGPFPRYQPSAVLLSHITMPGESGSESIAGTILPGALPRGGAHREGDLEHGARVARRAQEERAAEG